MIFLNLRSPEKLNRAELLKYDYLNKRVSYKKSQIISEIVVVAVAAVVVAALNTLPSYNSSHRLDC